MKKNYTLLAILAAAFTTQAGCVDAGESLRILRNQSPTEGCTISPTSTEFLPSGVIDVAANNGYLFTPIVENRATATEPGQRLAFVDGADVRLKFTEGFYDAARITSLADEGLSRFHQPFSGSIDAGGVSTFLFEVIPWPMLQDMAPKLAPQESTRVTVEVEIKGTIDGSGVGSPTFTYPIVVCNGCLTNVLGSCATLPEVDISTGGMCQTLQDGVADCCTRSDGDLACPAVAPAGEQE